MDGIQRHNSSQSVRVDMTTTRTPAAGSGDALGSGRLGSGGGGGGDKNSRGSGRVKDLKDPRDVARDRRRDNRDTKNLPLKDGRAGDKGEETCADEDEEAPPRKEWIDVIHDKVPVDARKRRHRRSYCCHFFTYALWRGYRRTGNAKSHTSGALLSLVHRYLCVVPSVERYETPRKTFYSNSSNDNGSSSSSSIPWQREQRSLT